MMRSLVAALFLLPVICSANFDFDACSGSGSFRTGMRIRGDSVGPFDIPPGLEDLKILVESNRDVDLQLSSGGTEIINWKEGLLRQPSEETITWRNDTITYSGYIGGKEYAIFGGETSNAYKMYVHVHESSVAMVSYSYSDWVGCDEDKIRQRANGVVTEVVTGLTGIALPVLTRWRQYLRQE